MINAINIPNCDTVQLRKNIRSIYLRNQLNLRNIKENSHTRKINLESDWGSQMIIKTQNFLFAVLTPYLKPSIFLKNTQLSYQLNKLTQNHNRVPKDYSKNSIIMFLILCPLTETNQETKRNKFSKKIRKTDLKSQLGYL